MTACLWYREAQPYALASDLITQTCLRPEEDIVTKFVELTKDGLLTLREGFDFSPSVPGFVPFNERTRKAMMRGSAVHDGLYLLHRMGLLFDREGADNELRRICLEDGLPEAEAESVWRAVRSHGEVHADPLRVKHPVCAP